VRAEEKSAEAGVARKRLKGHGVKGRRSTDTTHRLPSAASSHPQQDGVATTAASRLAAMGNARWIRVEAKAAGGKPRLGASSSQMCQRGVKLWTAHAVGSNRRMRKTACPVVWEGVTGAIPLPPPDTALSGSRMKAPGFAEGLLLILAIPTGLAQATPSVALS
jgi:hypothetical protein